MSYGGLIRLSKAMSGLLLLLGYSLAVASNVSVNIDIKASQAFRTAEYFSLDLQVRWQPSKNLELAFPQ